MSNRSRIEGCLLGLALGDSAGAPVEGKHPQDISRSGLSRAQWPAFPGSKQAGWYTDDTQVSLLLLESLLLSAQFSVDLFAERLVRASQGERVKRFGILRGTGVNFRNSVEALADNTPWNQSGQDSEGNGAAMRVAPLALFYSNDRPRLLPAVIEQSLVTHRKTEGILAAVALAVAISLETDPTAPQSLDEKLRLLRNQVELAHETLMDDYQPYLLETVPKRPVFFSMLDLLDESMVKSTEENARMIAAKAHKSSRSPIRLGTESYALASVTTALAVGLNAKDWFDAIVSIITLGGDTDTTAAMVGALAGARFGVQGLPQTWLEKAPWVPFIRAKARELERVMTSGEAMLPTNDVIDYEAAHQP